MEIELWNTPLFLMIVHLCINTGIRLAMQWKDKLLKKSVFHQFPLFQMISSGRDDWKWFEYFITLFYLQFIIMIIMKIKYIRMSYKLPSNLQLAIEIFLIKSKFNWEKIKFLFRSKDKIDKTLSERKIAAFELHWLAIYINCLWKVIIF